MPGSHFLLAFFPKLCYTLKKHSGAPPMKEQQSDILQIAPVAYIETDFNEKFALPRQSGMCPDLCGRIRFTAPFAHAEAVRELDGFSHIWLIFGFSQNTWHGGSLTVRPPRLGGNRRVGVFASRAPFRPNGLGLSCVRLLSVEYEENGAPLLLVGGVDLANTTPIYDIKPYLPFSDCCRDAKPGYTALTQTHSLAVHCPPQLLQKMPPQRAEALLQVLRQDPRPGYKTEDEAQYGFRYAGNEIKFTVKDGVLTVLQID